MRLTTRLLLSVLPIVVIVMGALGYAFAFERQGVLEPASREQTRAYAHALDIAFEHSLQGMGDDRVQALLERLIADPRVYGARLYGVDGGVRFASTSMSTSPAVPDSILRAVLAGDAEASFESSLDGEVIFTVLRAVRDPSVRPDLVDSTGSTGAVVGALEVSQPSALLSSELRRLQRELLAATVALLALMAVVIGILARRLVAQPLQRLIVAARALGAGDTEARVPQALGAAELNALSREFNEMAQRLARAREALVNEGEERVRLERRLVETEKLATVGTLAAGLAHEIGAPLNVISGRAELLLGQSSVTPDAVRQLEIIVTQSGRIARTVRSLLDYARRPARRDDPVSIDKVIDSTLELLDVELERASVTISRVGSYEGWIRGDAEQLQQLLTNLVLNALQAMNGQSSSREIQIGVSTSGDASVVGGHPGAPAPGAPAVGARLRLTVADTGSGLPQSLDGRLFTPFATTKPTGTGLGLMVARSIVEDHGGSIDGTNRTDGRSGAIFTVTLPLPEASGPAASSPASHPVSLALAAPGGNL